MANYKKDANITETELLILSHIRKNARKSIAGISAETDIPVSTVLSRLRLLEANVVKKYTTLVDFQKIGYNVLINFAIKASQTAEDQKRIKQFLLSHPSVNSLFSAAGDYDFYAEAVFYDIKSLYDFVDELSMFNIERLDEHHIIEEIKKEEFLSRHEPSSQIQYPKHMMLF
jgi:DNA-binding Lrp family transcriptional regulator